MSEVTVSKHAAKRIRQRLGLNKSSVEKLATAAYEKGTSASEFSGMVRHHLDRLRFAHPNADRTTFKVYNSYVYIFDETHLVTVYILVDELRKANAPKTHKARKAHSL